MKKSEEILNKRNEDLNYMVLTETKQKTLFIPFLYIFYTYKLNWY